MIRKLVVFVLNNTLTTLIAEGVIRNDKTADYCAVLIGEKLQLDGSLWNNILYKNIVCTRKYGMYWFIDTMRVKHYLRALSTIIKDYDEVEFVVPNVNNILTNYLVLSNQELCRDKRVSISLIYEGMLYSIFRQKIWIDHCKYFIKKVVCLFLGLRYCAYPWPETGVNIPFVKSIYYTGKFESEGGLAQKIHVEICSHVKSEIVPDDDSCLIIGSYVHTLLEKSKYIELAEYFSRYIKEQGRSKIYYKVHPRYIDEKDPMLAYFEGVSVIRTPHPIEVELQEIRSRHIYSFYSTALETIVDNYGENVTCYSYGIDFFEKNIDSSYCEIKKKFISNGVVCVDHYKYKNKN